MKKQTLKATLAGIFLLIQNAGAQTYEVQAGDVVKSKVSSEKFVGTDAYGNIYMSGVRTKTKMYLPIPIFTYVHIDVEKYLKKYDSRLQLVSDQEILSENMLIRQSQINGSIKGFALFGMTPHNLDLPTFMLDGKYYMVAQESKAPRNNYYAMNVDIGSGAVNQMTHLMALSKNKNDDERKVKKFSVSFSPDSSRILFLAVYKKDRAEKSGVAYSASVMTKDMKPVYTSNYTLPKVSKSFSIKEAMLTNSGEILIVGRQYDKKRRTGYVSVFSVKKEDKKPKESRLKFGTDHVDDVMLSINKENKPMVTGFYRNSNKKYDYDGIFYASLNENKELYEVYKKEFTGSERSQKKGKDVVEDRDFAFSEFIKTSDGGYVGIAENYDMVTYDVMEMNTHMGTSHTAHAPTTRTEYRHYYNDLIVVKFNKEGNIQSMNKIGKRKVYITSSPDKMYERDYASFDHDGNVYLVFNDDPGQNNVGRRGRDQHKWDATYIVCIKQDGTVKKDLLIENKQLGKYTFDPHKKLQKLADNRIAFVAIKGAERGISARKATLGNIAVMGPGKSRKSIIGTFTIKNEQDVVNK